MKPVGEWPEDDVAHMVSELLAVGYASPEAKAVRLLAEETRAVIANLEERADRLRGVLQAMEWWRSADWSEAQLLREIARYRGITPPACSRCSGTSREPGGPLTLRCQRSDCLDGIDYSSIRGAA